MKKLFLIIVPMLLMIAANAQRVPVKVSALPDPIPRFLNTSYPGFAIDTAYSVVSNNKVTYETVATKGTIRETLVFDEKGTFLAKQPVEKTTIDASPSGMNQKNNALKKRSNRKINNVAAEDKEEEKPVQKNEPDKMPAKK